MEQLKKISASEVSLHTSRKDLWLVIHGKVYDVSTFLELHPGGEDVLLHVSASGDATDSFEDVGHSSKAKKLMTSFMIGVLDGYEGDNAHVEVNSLKTDEDDDFKTQMLEEIKPSNKFMDILLPLLMLGVAFAAWIYLIIKNKV